MAMAVDPKSPPFSIALPATLSSLYVPPPYLQYARIQRGLGAPLEGAPSAHYDVPLVSASLVHCAGQPGSGHSQGWALPPPVVPIHHSSNGPWSGRYSNCFSPSMWRRGTLFRSCSRELPFICPLGLLSGLGARLYPPFPLSCLWCAALCLPLLYQHCSELGHFWSLESAN